MSAFEGGWEEHIDPASNQKFYYNATTEETSWDPPPTMKINRSRGFLGMSLRASPRILHESLMPGSSYDNGVEFHDLRPESRALFSDQSEGHTFSVRGPTYLYDKEKVDPGAGMAKLLLLEVFEVEKKDGDRHDHIVSRGLAKARLDALRTLPDDLFFFVINFQIPGDPPVSLATYFALPVNLMERSPTHETATFLSLLERFVDAPRSEEERLASWGLTNDQIAGIMAGQTAAGVASSSSDLDGGMEGYPHSHSLDSNEGDRSRSGSDASGQVKRGGGLFGMISSVVGGGGRKDDKGPLQRLREIRDVTWPSPSDRGVLPPTDFRNERFKLIPNIPEGPWVVKSAVGSTPVMLGKKVVQRYFRGDDYLEIDIHVGSSIIASNVVGLCRGYAQALVADCAVIIQGESPEELPERVLCCARLHHIDLSLRRRLLD